MAGLTVLIDHVAQLRDQMKTAGPDPVDAAVLAKLAGVDGIGITLSEENHAVRLRDLRLLRRTLDCRLVLYMVPNSEMVGLALDIKPDRVVLLPEAPISEPIGQAVDLSLGAKDLFETVGTLQANAISVGVTINPTPQQAKAARQLDVNWVLLDVGALKAAASVVAQTRELDNMIDTIKMAHKLRLNIAIGNGLDYRLIKLFKGVMEIDEFSIGRSVVAKAVLVGMDQAVRDMLRVIRNLRMP